MQLHFGNITNRKSRYYDERSDLFSSLYVSEFAVLFIAHCMRANHSGQRVIRGNAVAATVAYSCREWWQLCATRRISITRFSPLHLHLCRRLVSFSEAWSTLNLKICVRCVCSVVRDWDDEFREDRWREREGGGGEGQHIVANTHIARTQYGHGWCWFWWLNRSTI